MGKDSCTFSTYLPRLQWRHDPDLTWKAEHDAMTLISPEWQIVSLWPKSHLAGAMIMILSRGQIVMPQPRSQPEGRLWRHDPDLTSEGRLKSHGPDLTWKESCGAMTQISPGKQNMTPWPWSHLDGRYDPNLTLQAPWSWSYLEGRLLWSHPEGRLWRHDPDLTSEGRLKSHGPDLTWKASCGAMTQISPGKQNMTPWPWSHLDGRYDPNLNLAGTMILILSRGQIVMPQPWSHPEGRLWRHDPDLTSEGRLKSHGPDLTWKASCGAMTQISPRRQIVTAWYGSHLERQTNTVEVHTTGVAFVRESGWNQGCASSRQNQG
jgi:hypothetical protein